MQKLIQIRGVPETVHRRLRVRAAAAGLPLSQYLLRELEEIAKFPTLTEMRERLRGREPATGEFSSAAIIRQEREGR